MRRFRAVAIALAACCILAIGAVSWQRPAIDWDLLAYVGIVEQWRGLDPGAAHDAAYADVDAYAQAHDLADRAAALREGPYRAAAAADPAIFAEQLPFYRIRPLYLAVLAGLSALTGSVTAAAVAISALAVTLLCALLLAVAVASLGPVPGSLLAALLALSPPIAEVAQLTTPDALATLALGAGALLLLAGRALAGAALLLAAVLVRTDLALFDACLGLALLPRPGARAPGILLLAAIPLVALVNAWAGNYGYTVLYRFTFIDGFVPHPAALQGHAITPAAFLRNTVYGLRYSLGNGGLWPVLAAMAACAALLRTARRVEAALLLAVAAATAGRFVLFPAHDVRLNAPPLAVLAALLVALWSGARRRSVVPAAPGPLL